MTRRKIHKTLVSRRGECIADADCRFHMRLNYVHVRPSKYYGITVCNHLKSIKKHELRLRDDENQYRTSGPNHTGDDNRIHGGFHPQSMP